MAGGPSHQAAMSRQAWQTSKAAALARYFTGWREGVREDLGADGNAELAFYIWRIERELALACEELERIKKRLGPTSLVMAPENPFGKAGPIYYNAEAEQPYSPPGNMLQRMDHEHRMGFAAMLQAEAEDILDRYKGEAS